MINLLLTKVGKKITRLSDRPLRTKLYSVSDKGTSLILSKIKSDFNVKVKLNIDNMELKVGL